MANPQNSRATPHKRGQCAKHEHRPIPPEKDQNVQTEHLGMARSARRAGFEGSAQRKRPLHGKIFARCIPKRLFAGLFGCMARISCQSQLISDAWRANLATAAPSRMLLDGILPRRPSAARACCEIAVAPRSRKTPPERSVGQFNNARRHVQETMKIFWCLSPRNGTENVLA